MSSVQLQPISATEVSTGLASNPNPDTLYYLNVSPYTLYRWSGSGKTVVTLSAAGIAAFQAAPIISKPSQVNMGTGAAISGTATITGAQLATGLLVFTGGAGTQTLPTAAALLAALGTGGGAGTAHDFYVDNSAGSGTCTLAVSASILVPATVVVTGGATLTVAGQATGLACFRILFSSATAAVVFRLG